MILIDGNKYSCLECIRGHRSSLCRHHTRALLQVRSKGRPNFQDSPENRNHRIAVFAEKVADPSDNSAKDCKNVPVVILKTSDKHVIDISNGRIVGPYKDSAVSFQLSKPLVKAFVNSSSCCSKGASGIRKACQCHKGKVSQSKILKSYINKKIKQQELGVASCCSKKAPLPPILGSRTINSCETTKKTLAQPASLKTDDRTDGSAIGYLNSSQYSALGLLLHQENTASASSTQIPLARSISTLPASNFYVANSKNDVFQVINVPNCSLPGTCSCSSDCACPNCMTHNNINTEHQNMHELEFLSSDSQFESNLILTLRPQLRHDHGDQQHHNHNEDSFSSTQSSLAFPTTINENAYNTPMDQSPTLQTYQNEPLYLPTNGSPAHLEPNFISPPNEVLSRTPGMQQQYSGGFPLEFDFYNSILKQVVGNTVDIDSPSSHPSEEENSCNCACPDDDCGCKNCETHGIIDGYKLDDIFLSKIPLGEFSTNGSYPI